MAKTIKEERLRWILPIINNEMMLVDIAKICPYSKRSLERWVSVYRQGGEQALEPKSTRPKTNPNETPLWLKQKIIDIRKETSKCALKIHWELKKKSFDIDPRTVGKILKVEGLTRKYHSRKTKYEYVRAKLEPGEIVEIDVKYVPDDIQGKPYFQYTATDVAGRWRYLKAYSEQSSSNSIHFTAEVQRRAPFLIKAIKTDNHSTFTNKYTGYAKSADPLKPRLHPLDIWCEQNEIVHYLIDRGKPAQNGTIERSHRSDQQMFYDRNVFKSFEELQYRMRLWNMYYNDLEHCGLNGRTPNEFVRDYQLIKPPYVCA